MDLILPLSHILIRFERVSVMKAANRFKYGLGALRVADSTLQQAILRQCPGLIHEHCWPTEYDEATFSRAPVQVNRTRRPRADNGCWIVARYVWAPVRTYRPEWGAYDANAEVTNPRSSYLDNARMKTDSLLRNLRSINKWWPRPNWSLIHSNGRPIYWPQVYIAETKK